MAYVWEDTWNFKEGCQERLTKELTSESRFKEHAMKVPGGTVFLAEGTANVKALRERSMPTMGEEQQGPVCLEV